MKFILFRIPGVNQTNLTDFERFNLLTYQEMAHQLNIKLQTAFYFLLMKLLSNSINQNVQNILFNFIYFQIFDTMILDFIWYKKLKIQQVSHQSKLIEWRKSE